MSWFKIDDGFYAHPKVKSIPRRDRAAAIGLWTLAGSWCAQQLTDGFVPEYMIEEFGVHLRVANALATATLWDANDEKHGWNFHDWHAHQPSRETVQAKRKQSAERIAAWRAAKRGQPAEDVTPLQDDYTDVTQSFGNAGETLTPTRPDPTRPDPTPLPTEEGEKTSSTAAPSSRYPRDFTLFWDQYPKKVGKDAALRKWKAALRRASVEDIITGAKRYAADPARDPQFTKDPATWLNGGHWGDEPERRPLRSATDQFRKLG